MIAALAAAIVACAACDETKWLAPRADQPGGNGSVATGPGNPGGAADKTVTHQVIDESGFSQPMEAVQIQVPAGWQVSSEVRWDGNGRCTLDTASPTARLISPDGLEVIDLLPGFLVSTWPDPILNRGIQPADYCVVAQAETGEALLRNVAAPMLRPGATLQKVHRRTPPAHLTQAVEQQRGTSTNGEKFDAYAVEGILLSADGQAQEKLILKGTVMILPPLGNGIPPMILNQNSFSLALRAPPARMAQLETLASAVLASVRFNPEWQNRVGETKRQISRTIDEGIRDRGRVPRRRSPTRIGGAKSQDEWQAEQDRETDRNKRFVETVIQETERCYNPETGETVTVSIHDGC